MSAVPSGSAPGAAAKTDDAKPVAKATKKKSKTTKKTKTKTQMAAEAKN